METQQSIYLLGLNNSQSPLFSALTELIEEFAEQGIFLTTFDHTQWLCCYQQDAQSLQTMLPVLVFQPTTTSSIAPFLNTCYSLNIPVRVRCGGTGVVGGAVAAKGGIILLISHLQKILFFDKTTGIAVVEPGVTPSEINRLDSNWFIPLDMLTNGVAGLGACLNTNAQSYYCKNDWAFLRSILSVTIVDGRGNQLRVPPALICGSEGLFGVVTELRIQLVRTSFNKRYFQITCTLETLLSHLPFLRLIQGLQSLWWDKETECLKGLLHIEEWRWEQVQKRMDHVFSASVKWLETDSFLFEPIFGRWNIRLHSTFPIQKLPLAISILETLCVDRGLNMHVKTNILEGSIYCWLSSQQELDSFHKVFQLFMIEWIHVLEVHEGELFGCYGIGQLLSTYTPPFYSEEDLRFFKEFVANFDPGQLFSRDSQFFPKEGKCLIKRL